jgi:hypothetical protein
MRAEFDEKKFLKEEKKKKKKRNLAIFFPFRKGNIPRNNIPNFDFFPHFGEINFAPEKKKTR